MVLRTLIAKCKLLVLLVLQLSSIFAQSFRCDEGPPGRYCTEDLSGYHICEVLQTGPKDTLVKCPDGTRCSCHFGPKCPIEIDPCSTYVQPPVFGYSFTLRYHGFVKNIVPTGVFVRHTQGLWYQYHAGMESRQSFTDWEGANRRQLLIIPDAGRDWVEYTANEAHCTKKPVIDFPVYRIPLNYNADGQETILGVKTTRWKRITGGRTTGSPVKIQYMYSRYDRSLRMNRPVRIYDIQLGLRWTQIVNKTVGLFFSELAPLSMDVFRKPPVC